MPLLTDSAFGRTIRGLRKQLTFIQDKYERLPDDPVTLGHSISAVQSLMIDWLAHYKSAVSTYEDIDNFAASLSVDTVDDEFSTLMFEFQELKYNVGLAKCQVGVATSGTVSPAGSVTQTSHCSGSLRPQLSNLQLPKFDGKITSWDNFKAKFESLVDSDPSLSNLLKLQYLLSSLDETSLSLVNHLELKDENYQVALDVLKQRYHNPVRKAFTWAFNVLHIPTMSLSNVKQLINSVDVLNANVKALGTLSAPSVHEALAVAFLVSKFDMPLLDKFHDKFKNKFPLVNDVIGFLTELVQHRDAVFQLNRQLKPFVPKTLSNKPAPKHVFISNASDRVSKDTHLCVYCRVPNHSVVSCKMFLTNSISDRIKWASRSNYCKRCLEHELSVPCVNKQRCALCSGNHHSLLHLPVGNKPSFSSVKHNQFPPCPICKLPKHALSVCEEFIKLPISVRIKRIEELKCCTRCLRQHEGACFSKVLCLHCSKEHHTLLHEQPSESSSALAMVSGTIPTLISEVASSQTVLMATAFIRLSVSNESSIIVRCVVDTAAAVSLVSEYVMQYLKCSRRSARCQVSGLGGLTSEPKGVCHLDVSSLSSQTVSKDHSFVILNRISCNTPAQPVSLKLRQLVEPYQLADPHFDTPSRIDCILGADIAARVLLGSNPINLGPDLPCIVPTMLGYIILGTAPTVTLPACDFKNSESTHVGEMSVCIATPKQIDRVIESFWELDEPSTALKLSKTDLDCETYYKDTVTRLESGRYQVRLPFISDSPVALGGSFGKALIRLKGVETKFRRDSMFKIKYVDFMNDYLVQKHMVLADGLQQYYIPHHGIFKAHGEVHKLRVVYDASCITSNGKSLNDLLYAGPALQPLITDVITQFRFHKVAFSTDIRQMFRQINIDPRDYPYQCIVWRESESLPIQVYYLTTVAFGVKSAPYLAIRTLKQLVSDDGHLYPLAAQALSNSVFVDDILVGASSLSEALNLKNEIVALLGRGCFELRKWMSNSTELLGSLPADWVDEQILNGTRTEVSILGLTWNLGSDSLVVNTPEIIPLQPTYTKRQVTSIIPQVFDPCGWWGPVMLTAKITLQRLWALKVGWDEQLPKNILSDWIEFLETLHFIKEHEVPRCLNLSHDSRIIIHGFCDASSLGMAAVVYVCREEVEQSGVMVISKSKVAPLKTHTIPRLELCSAYLLALLVEKILPVFESQFKIIDIRLWSDSTIALSWLSTEPHLLKTFVANRVASIQRLDSMVTWGHVSSTSNPADIASRGCTAKQLLNDSLWWSGPEWLPHRSQWPSLADIQHPVEEIRTEFKEKELIVLTCQSNLISNIMNSLSFERISSWSKLCYVVKVIMLWRCKVKKLSLPTYDHVVRSIVYYIQQLSFKDLIIKLKNNRPLDRHLRSLSPFIDEYGCIRVSGRLNNSVLVKNKTPYLLPHSNRFVQLLILHYHLLYKHSGNLYTLYQLNLDFWILRARREIRTVLHKCVTCFRAKPSCSPQLMGQLPKDRVNFVTPFESVGMDYAGPFNLKSSHVRKSGTYKAWLCIFICMSTKAVHLELVTDLSTKAFLDAFKRFTSRRGVPRHVYSDSGTCFIGADNYFRKIWRLFWDNSEVRSAVQAYGWPNKIEFHFNTPSAAHQGGLWERAIRSVKHHLIRALSDQVPTWEALNSIVIYIEGILNSRPLTPMSGDPGDLEALTPGHFLIGRPLTDTLTEPTLVKAVTPRHFKWRQQIVKYVWDRWHREYLMTLFPRPKWHKPMHDLKLNDLVVINETNTPPLTWRLARIIELIAGPDGLVRSVKLRTKNGQLVRPVTKIAKLPIYESND